ARGEKRIFMDADLATPLRHVPAMARALDDQEVVIGVRKLSAIHKGFIRAFLSRAGNFLIRSVLLPKIRDTQCGFKGFSAVAAQKLFGVLKTTGWGFDMEILARARRAGYTIGQISIPDWREARTEGMAGDSKTGVALQSLGELARIKSILTLERWPLLQKMWWLIPVVALVLAGLLYSYDIGRWSIWFDEAFGAKLITFSPTELIAYTAADVHPPLYYLLLQAWANIFGHGETALRSFSAIGMLAALGVGFAFVRRYFGACASYMVLPFLVFAPFLLRYSQEARMYGLATLICISATFIFAHIHEASTKYKKWWWAAYILLVVAGLYTHYYTGLIWIAHWAWHWYDVRQTGQKFFTKTWLIIYGIIALAFLPWAPILIKQFAGVQAGFWIGPVSHQSLLNIASNTLTYHSQTELVGWLSVAFMAMLVGIATLLYATYKSLHSERKKHFVLLSLYAFVPIVVLFMLSLPPLKPVLVERYFIPAMLGLYMLIGICFALAPKAKRWYQSKILLAGLILGFFAYGITNAYTVGNFNYNQGIAPSAKALMASIEPRTGPSDAIIANSPYGYYEFDYYTTLDRTYFLDESHILGVIGSTAMLVGDPHLVHNLEVFGKTKDHIWLIGAGDVSNPLPSNWRKLETIIRGDYNATLYDTGN
ncbi:MAG TPA: glycosyltransferase family 39 protein, partial [Magnetospirillaceae bacterium]|nr:glycosyltransferase family 39 protein [Magnetospirillaceae bacterium]